MRSQPCGQRHFMVETTPANRPRLAHPLSLTWSRSNAAELSSLFDTCNEDGSIQTTRAGWQGNRLKEMVFRINGIPVAG